MGYVGNFYYFGDIQGIIFKWKTNNLEVKVEAVSTNAEPTVRFSALSLPPRVFGRPEYPEELPNFHFPSRRTYIDIKGEIVSVGEGPEEHLEYRTMLDDSKINPVAVAMIFELYDIPIPDTYWNALLALNTAGLLTSPSTAIASTSPNTTNMLTEHTDAFSCLPWWAKKWMGI